MPYIDWLGKGDVVHHHKEIVYKTIDCQEVVGDVDSDNLIIKGDNLLALKSLLPYYANAVKMIYIDPPYNTGNTSWVYNDNMDSPLIKKWLNDTVNADDLSRSDKWLCMMYPRLKLLRELLKEDGVIFISIDDAEVAHLRMMCDEIFGTENFVGQIVWQKRKGGGNDSSFMAIDHEYILVYAKSIYSQVNNWRISFLEKHNKRYKNEDERGRYYWDTLHRGGLQSPIIYDVECPDGTIIKNGTWQISEKSFIEKLKNNQVQIIEKNNSWSVQHKVYQPLGRVFRSVLSDYTNTDSSNEIRDIFSTNKAFDTPKPIQLIKTLMELISVKSNDIILDSFAGSGTTAHAVIEQNRADGGKRKFILIETLDYAKEITAERVKRVQQGYAFKGKDKTLLYEKKLTTAQVLKPTTMEKIGLEVEKLIEKEKPNYDKIEKTFKDNVLKVVGIKNIERFKEGLGGGFKYCELGEEIFDESGELNPKLSFADIAKHIYFVEFKQALGKTELVKPYVGSYKERHLYFYEKQFKSVHLTALVKKHEKHKQIIVYTRRCAISADRLKEHHVTVRYIPYDIKDN